MNRFNFSTLFKEKELQNTTFDFNIPNNQSSDFSSFSFSGNSIKDFHVQRLPRLKLHLQIRQLFSSQLKRRNGIKKSTLRNVYPIYMKKDKEFSIKQKYLTWKSQTQTQNQNHSQTQNQNQNHSQNQNQNQTSNHTQNHTQNQTQNQTQTHNQTQTQTQTQNQNQAQTQTTFTINSSSSFITAFDSNTIDATSSSSPREVLQVFSPDHGLRWNPRTDDTDIDCISCSPVCHTLEELWQAFCLSYNSINFTIEDMRITIDRVFPGRLSKKFETLWLHEGEFQELSIVVESVIKLNNHIFHCSKTTKRFTNYYTMYHSEF